MVNKTNGYDAETGTYYHMGKAFDNATDYSASVQALRTSLGMDGTKESGQASSQLSDVEQRLVNDFGWTDNGNGTLTAKSTGKVYDHEAGTTFAERHGLSQDYSPESASIDLAQTSTESSTQKLTQSTNSDIEVPTMHVEFKRDEAGNILKDAEGKNVVESFGVKYADGTISYTGAGREGVLEAARQRSQALEYNKYINDNRTREDFASDQEYQNHMIVKNIRIGQGAYKIINNKDGTSTLYAPSNIIITSGTAEQIKNEYRSRSNKLNMALTRAQKEPSITPFGVRFMMEQQGYATEKDVYKKLYQDYKNRGQDLKNILNNWGNLAVDQNLKGGPEFAKGAMGYLNNIAFPTQTTQYEDFDTDFENNYLNFKSNYTLQDDPSYASYDDFLFATTGQAPETTQTTTGTGTYDTNKDVGITGAGTTTGGGMTGTAGTEVGGTGTSLPTLDNLPSTIPFGDNTGIGGTMTGTGGTQVTGTGTTTQQSTPTNYNPYAGTFTYTGSPTDQMAAGVFTMGQTPPQATQGGIGGGMTGQAGTPVGQTEVRMYRNAAGLTAGITFVNGQPQTPIPQGFYPVSAQPQQAMGNTSVDMSNTQVQMAQGGVIYAQTGVDVTGATDYQSTSDTLETKATPTTLGQQYVPIQPEIADNAGITDIMEYQAKTPGLHEGAAVVPAGITETQGQFVSPKQGQVTGDVTTTTTGATTTMASIPDQTNANLMTAAQTAPAVNTAVEATQAATLAPEDSKAQITAAQATSSSVSNLEAATGNHIKLENPTTREIMDGEIISGSADAQKAAKFTEQIQAAEATPSKQATVQGQLEGMMQQFEGGATPPWAAGAMRAATQTLAARGLGASSMAGQAVIQAAMESALPIAQADAQTIASFEAQNLSNRQQRAMLAAQQRAEFMGQEFDQDFQAKVFNATKIGEVANINFTAEQQIALENSRAANTMELQNLNNEQALVMAEAAALSQLDAANLNNRQQAAVQNAQNFLSLEMQNLSNKQQTELFKKQNQIQALFNDQAAINAAEQFNATSENQTDQFFASLTADVSKHNSIQANAQAQFNAGEANAMTKFTEEINNQREQFNANNRLVIDQSNAQWRREIATADTAQVNRANEINASNVLGMNQAAYNNLWNYYSDSMSWAWTSAENERERAVNLAIEQLRADSKKDIQNIVNDYNSSANFGAMIGKIMTTDLSGSFLEGAWDSLTSVFD